MSHVQRQSMGITSWNKVALIECRREFIAAEIPVTTLYESATNGYETFFVIPCGSKAGWNEEAHHLGLIEKAKTMLKSYEHEDGSSPIEYCVSIYGESEG